MRNKAFVPILEMIIVILILVVAFSVFFPGFSYQSRWEQAFISLKGRDVVLTMDRINNLYKNSFDENSLRDFVDRTIPTASTNLIHWSALEGSIKPKVTVACFCTNAQKNSLISWIGRLTVNGRDIDIDINSFSNLNIIPKSDVLLIWGDDDLTQYQTSLQNYLRAGKGIVEIRDLNQATLNDAQKNIFGLNSCTGISIPCGGGQADDFFIEPATASSTAYTGYKYFHHIPMTLWTIDSSAIQLEGDLNACESDVSRGIFRIRERDYNFWICGGASVYFDTDGNGNADTKKSQTDADKTFSIDGQKLLLNYIKGLERIGVSFLNGYRFVNFLQPNTNLYPDDEDVSRILLSNGNYDSTHPIPVAIVKKLPRTAWVADFGRVIDSVGDDHKLLLASLIIWASDNKHISGLGNLRLGHLTSYINVVNEDMYEVYKFELGLGFPF